MCFLLHDIFWWVEDTLLTQETLPDPPRLVNASHSGAWSGYRTWLTRHRVKRVTVFQKKGSITLSQIWETTCVKVRNTIVTAAEIASLPSMINELTIAAKQKVRVCKPAFTERLRSRAWPLGSCKASFCSSISQCDSMGRTWFPCIEQALLPSASTQQPTGDIEGWLPSRCPKSLGRAVLFRSRELHYIMEEPLQEWCANISLLTVSLLKSIHWHERCVHRHTYLRETHPYVCSSGTDFLKTLNCSICTLSRLNLIQLSECWHGTN